ncbi:glycosyltransferase family 4 protein [Sulfuritalea hydrogenivorans]|uniref:Glycosyltransferase n=1 Tax=Sulfuritalea hydrogenivorans sk43H TaxID=1223802 RepID=W0SKA3_9PROT|nr:glycosyltransferase family 4 protein [Sulfuritalea hydrogenivorans]BAO31297.1 glycosyltransferase [Sulfuritalea hydrogenivorans sk43H]
MKILHTEASCGWGGQEIRILEESRGLIARGHEVTVVCPAHARTTAEAARFGVPVVSLPIEFKTIAGFKALRDYLASHASDVVNTHSSADSWLTSLACASLANPPAIVRTRHISAPVSGNFANRWLYRQASAVVTTGESLRRHVIDTLGLDPQRVTSVPTGIDTERFAPADKAAATIALGLDPQHKHLGIVATLRSWKGHLFLLDAFAQLKRPELRLLIVGEGPMRGPIEEKIAALGIRERVMLAGQRSDPERWLQAMDVFCLPSYANEGVPQAILQAMLCGLPIVTTPVGAILEAVSDKNSALIVPPKDAAALAAAIGRLLDDSTLAATLGAEARRVASADFSREAMLDRMEPIFSAAMRDAN